MNYLAHAYLSPPDPLILLGNLWGDLLKPKDYLSLQEGIRFGVEQHKKIDTFTDQHQAVNEIMKLLRPYQGKYTPVVADVLMDFILSKLWGRYQIVPLEVFCQNKYDIVSTYIQFIPERLHPRINRMLSHHWLESCSSRERMENTLTMLSRRASFQNTIIDAMVPYDLHQSRMDALFMDFFEDVQKHINLQNED